MLSGATASEGVPELQLFANLTTEEGAPPLSYWEGLYDQLKKVDCELDFPAIEERVFNCLVLGPKAMNQAEDGRLLSFAPPPLLFIGKGDISWVILKQGSQRSSASLKCTTIFWHIKRGLRRRCMTCASHTTKLD
jgi:hypothetical protein